MKKSLFLLTAVAVAFFSCEKEQDITVENAEESLTWETISFTAGLETDADTSVKTVLNTSDGSVTWAATDKLSVVYDGGSVETSEAGSAGDKASFSATLPGGKEALFLVYPSSATAEYESSSLKVTVPSTQDGTFASAAIEVGQYSGSCSLKNLGGLLAITTTADVDEIVVHSNNSTPLAGKATVAFTDGIPSVSSVESGSTAVTLSGLTGAGTYYAAVLPDSYDAGIYVELKNSSSLVGEKLSGNTLNVPRRKIMRLNVGDPGVMNKLFFKPDGAGDGSSWDSPKGPSDLYDALRSGSDTYIFLAQGEYAPGKETTLTSHAFYIYGGYPSSNTGTSLEGRNTSVETAITGEDSYRLLVLNNASSRLVADGITFKNAKHITSATGSALVFNSHGGSSLNQCIIKDNSTTNASAHGGAVRVKGTVKFTNCSFSGNYVEKASGGAVQLLSSGSKLTLDHCSFTDNHSEAAGTFGGAIIAFQGELVVKDCSFSGNYSLGGGAVRISTSSGGAVDASFSDCTFNGNYATNSKQNDADGALNGTGIGGAVFSLNGASGKEISVTIQDCQFLNNIAHPAKTALSKSSTLKGAGAIASIGHYTDVRVKDCVMRENDAGFAAFVVNSNSTLFLDRCRFWENAGLQDATVVYNNEGKVAVHNCSIQNSSNLQTQTDGHDNCYFYNTENGAMLLSCVTVRAASLTPIIKGSDSTPDNNTVVINNFFGSTNTTGGVFDATAKYKSHGHNVVTCLANWAGKDGLTDIDYTATNTNPAKNTTYYCLQASVAGLTFTKATRTDVTTAIGTFDTNNSTGVLTWLGEDAVSVDVLKNPRGATEIMPGCYE